MQYLSLDPFATYASHVHDAQAYDGCLQHIDPADSDMYENIISLRDDHVVTCHELWARYDLQGCIEPSLILESGE